MKRHEDNRFDQEVRHKLGHYSTPMAPYIWDKILSEVEVVDSTVSHWWKWAAIVLFTVGFGFRFWNPPIKMYAAEKNFDQQRGILANESSADFDPNGTTLEIALIDIDDEGIELKEETGEAMKTETLAEESALKELSQDKGLYRTSEHIAEEMKSDFQNHPVYLDESDRVNEDKERTVESDVEHTKIEIWEEATEQDKEKEIFSDTPALEDIAISADEMEDLGVSEPLSEINENVIESLDESPSSLLPADSNDGFVMQDEKEDEEMIAPLQEQADQHSESQNLGWSIELLYGPSLSYRSFDSEVNPELVSHKNSNDRSMLSANMSLMVRKYINEKWSVSAGVQTFNCGEKYSYTLNSATHEFDNSYNYISVPVEADYRIFQKAGIRLDVGIGAQYNYLREGTSSWVDLDSAQPVTHNNKGDESPFSESTIGFNSDVTARYRLSPRIDLIAQPRAVIFTKSLYKNETGLDQRPYALSMMVGLSADF